MKIRRVYKRDKDGQFAKVNTLLGAAADAAKKKRLKSKAHSLNRVPSKSDRRSNRNAPDPQVLDAAAGRLSLAEGPAREIAKKHDLSGHNRSEANKAAYRECAKYARELKAKYGADAPTADRIYSAAKLIQKGGDLSAKIRQEEGDGNGAPNPLPPKPPKKPSPDPNSGNGSDKKIKPVTSGNLWKLGTSDLIDQHKLAIQGNRPRIAERALILLKERASLGDQEAFDFLYKSPDGPKINGKTQKPTPEANGGKQLRRNDDTDPPVVRQNREKSVNKIFDAWFNSWAYDKNKSAIEQVDYQRRLVDDPEFKKQAMSEFLALLKDPSPLDNRDDAYTFHEFNLHGYHDLTPKERSALAESDAKLIDNWLNPEVQSARMDYAFKNWLETSPGAYDLATNYGYNTDDLFDIFMDGNDQFSWNNDYFDMTKIADQNRARWRKDSFDGASLAKAPRPPAEPDPRDVEPVPYRAKDNSIAELRREKASMEKELAFNITKVFGTSDFSKRPQAEQDAERAKYRKMLDDITKLEKEIENTPPDRSKSISAAKNLDELHDIFSNRNPKIKSLAGWHEPDGDLAKEMEMGGVYSEAHKRVVLNRCIKSFEAAEKMSDDYSEVPFDGLNARGEKSFSSGNAIAHCSRGLNIHIEMNVNYLVRDSPAPNKNEDGFHPQGFEKNPFYNVMVHEFGHSMDWFAFEMHDIAGDLTLLDRNMNKGIARDKIWAKAMEEVFDARDVELKRIMTDMYLEEYRAKRFTGSFNAYYTKHTSGYARTNYHELIAESWQDYHANGPKATPISIAITRYVLERYRNRMAKGKAQPYVIKASV